MNYYANRYFEHATTSSSLKYAIVHRRRETIVRLLRIKYSKECCDLSLGGYTEILSSGD